MENVSTNGIKGCAAEISNVINITTSIADKVQAACSDISNANSMLKSYNGAVVKGTREDKTTKNSDGLNIKQTYANFWKITGLGGDGNVSVLKDLSNEANRIISTVKSQVSDIEGIASAIDSYINSINTQLSEVGPALLTSDMLSAAYLAIGKDGVAKANLATSGEDINNRNFINYSDIKDNGLANTKLSFVLQDDGSYRVYSNGKETEFYTTGLAAAFYQKTLKRELENNLNTASNTPSKNTSQTKGAAAMAGAPTTGNRNIGNTNDSSSPLGETVTVQKDLLTSDYKKIKPGTYVETENGVYQKKVEGFESGEEKGKYVVTETKYSTEDLSNLIKIPNEVTVKENGFPTTYVYDGKKWYYPVTTSNDQFSTTTINGKKVINAKYSLEELKNMEN